MNEYFDVSYECGCVLHKHLGNKPKPRCHEHGAWLHEIVLSAGLKFREGDQPLPIKNNLPEIHTLVQQDIEARRQLGIKRYGTALQPYNGRDALRDLYEEQLDSCAYTRQLLYERDGK